MRHVTTTARSEARRRQVEAGLSEHLTLRGEAMRRGEDHDDDELGPSFPAARVAALPQQVREVRAQVMRRFDDADAGSTRVVELVDEAGPFIVLRTTSDGDDGCVFIFDPEGRCEGAARTLLELCEWDTVEATLALLRAPSVAASLPPSLKARRGSSVWMRFLRP
jgi:hypothetical protein